MDNYESVLGNKKHFLSENTFPGLRVIEDMLTSGMSLFLTL
jgi:hypothetical protein